MMFFSKLEYILVIGELDINLVFSNFCSIIFHISIQPFIFPNTILLLFRKFAEATSGFENKKSNLLGSCS